MTILVSPQPQPLRFLDTLVQLHATHDDCGISLVESRAPYGDSPPLHVHHTEDEAFLVLEGELRLAVGETELSLEAGQSTVAPRGVPHTYRVESEDGARWLVGTARGDFERFVRSLSRPAVGQEVPERSAPPTPEQAAALASAAAAHGIELVGPPLG